MGKVVTVIFFLAVTSLENTATAQLGGFFRPNKPVNNAELCLPAPKFLACRDSEKSLDFSCPVVRYCPWAFYSLQERTYLMSSLAYTAMSWNYWVTSPVEYTWFGGLTATQQCALRELGYDEDTHDCCNGHYEDYDWTDFSDVGYGEVLWAYKTIGYTEELWNSNNMSEIAEKTWEDYWWYELPEEVQNACHYFLCITKEIWDGVPLNNWEVDSVLPGLYHVDATVVSVTPSVSPSESFSGRPSKFFTNSPSGNISQNISNLVDELGESKSANGVSFTNATTSSESTYVAPQDFVEPTIASLDVLDDEFTSLLRGGN